MASVRRHRKTTQRLQKKHGQTKDRENARRIHPDHRDERDFPFLASFFSQRISSPWNNPKNHDPTMPYRYTPSAPRHFNPPNTNGNGHGHDSSSGRNHTDDYNEYDYDHDYDQAYDYEDGYHPTVAHAMSSSPPTSTSNSLTHARPSGGRKSSEAVNLNHLLNFSLPPRQPKNDRPLPRRSRGNRNNAFHKEKYVNAQFRFVMKPAASASTTSSATTHSSSVSAAAAAVAVTGKSYAAHLADPDVFFDWPNILQVIVPTVSALTLAQGDDLPSVTDDGGLQARSGSGRIGDSGLTPGDLLRARREREREGMSCPICLGHPVAGRITKCGHIFCFPCILHYFQLSDIPRTAKCPICGDTIQDRLLKAVKWWDPQSQITWMGKGGEDQGHQHGGGGGGTGQGTDSSEKVSLHHLASHDDIDDDSGHEPIVPGAGDRALDPSESASQSSPHTLTMRLVQRPHISTLALPRSSTWLSDAVPSTTAPWHFAPDVLAFSKFMLASTEYMVSELNGNISELEHEKIVLRGDELGITFVDAAIRSCRDQIEKAKMELDTPLLRKAEKEAREAIDEIQNKDQLLQKSRRLIDLDQPPVGQLADDAPLAFSSGPTLPLPTPPPPPPPTTAASSKVTTGPPPKPKSKNRKGANSVTNTVTTSASEPPCYYYYQSATGANIYLHPLDIKILLAHFKTYTSFPNTITVRPEGADEGTINEELRRRCKYLAHLQLGTEVVFVEADLEGTIGSEAVGHFEQALKQRRNRRRDKVKKEDRAKSKWEAKEREKMPFTAKPTMEEAEGDHDFLLALERSTFETGRPGSRFGSDFLASSNSPPPESHLSGRSLPIHSSGSRPTSNNIDSNSGWGAGAKPSFASALHLPHDPNRSMAPRRKEEVDADTEQAWNSFMASAASETVSEPGVRTAEGELEGAGATSSSAAAGGKKKKAKKVVLSMSSGGRRG